MTTTSYFDADSDVMELDYFETFKAGETKSHNTYSMGEFEDSFNMFVGSVNSSIDLLDNPYIEFNVYGLD